MALAIHLSTFVSGGFTNPVRWDLHETLSGALVDTHGEPGPHGQIYNFSFVDDIRDIVYTIKFYDVPGGAGLGNLIKSHDVTPSTSTLNDGNWIELIVDGGESYDPVSGTDTVTLTELIGKRIKLIQRGIGPWRELRDPEYTFDTNTGEIVLLNGVTFNELDTLFIKVIAYFVVNPPGSSNPNRIYKDIILVIADITLVAADMGKLFIVDGASPVVTIQLPAIGDLPAKIPLFIKTVGLTHKNVVVKADIGETITAIARESNTFIFGQAEEGEIILLDEVLYGFSESLDMKRVGQFDWNRSPTLCNRMWADGTEYVLANYPRLAKALDDGDCGEVVSYATWAATSTINGEVIPINHGFFAISDNGLNFKVPNMKNKHVRALKYIDATTDAQRLSQGAGGYQHDEFRTHTHSFNPGDQNGQSDNANDRNVMLPGSQTRTTAATGGAETRGMNIGLIPSIIF